MFLVTMTDGFFVSLPLILCLPLSVYPRLDSIGLFVERNDGSMIFVLGSVETINGGIGVPMYKLPLSLGCYLFIFVKGWFTHRPLRKLLTVTLQGPREVRCD